MINEWKEFLQNAGAEFDGTGATSFGNRRRELSVAITGNVFSDLSHYGLISVHGKDAETFLQGQLTNDVRIVDMGHSQLTGLCNPKGRLLASFRLFRHGDSFDPRSRLRKPVIPSCTSVFPALMRQLRWLTLPVNCLQQSVMYVRKITR
jgi:hypothetical protein